METFIHFHCPIHTYFANLNNIAYMYRLVYSHTNIAQSMDWLALKGEC